MKSILFPMFLYVCGFAPTALAANNPDRLLPVGDSLIVYVFLAETCPICKLATAELKLLHQQYAAQGVRFVGVFPNTGMSTTASIAKFGKKYKMDFALLLDENQTITRQLSATVTPQVFVVRKEDHKILYSGKIDNSFEGIGKRRQVVTAHYLQDALARIALHQPADPSETTPVGCFIIKQK